MTPPRLLVIGLDGATFDWLLPLAQGGQLPHLAAFLRRGCWGRLASTLPPFTGAAWSSLITGQDPGGHGILTFARRDRYNYDRLGHGFVNAGQFDLTLWEILSQAGLRLGVINVPLTYPPRPINGYMASGMLTPPGAAVFTYPPAFAGTLGPGYQIDVDFIRDGEQFRLRGLPPKAEMMAQIRRVTVARLATTSRLLRQEPVDFFMVVFTGTDRLSHFFWPELAALVAQKGQAKGEWSEQVLATLQELDAGIGRLLEETGPQTTVMLLSDHGFGPAPTWRFYVNVWLEQMGLLHPRPAAGTLDPEYWRVRLGRIKWLKRLARRLLPQATQDALTQATSSPEQDNLDWSATQAYFVPIYFHVCGLEINLAGERREGTVPASAYEPLRQRLIEAARALRHPGSGQPLVRTAARREELYHGRHVADFPDIILELEPDVVGAASLAGSSLFEPHPHPMRPGEHRSDGIFAAAGPAIPPVADLANLRLLDIAPTIMVALDLPVPSFFAGRPLVEIFHPHYLAAHPPRTVEMVPAATAEAAQLLPAETAQLEQRLRSLGYLE